MQPVERIAFTFWAGKEFSLLNLISLLTFAKKNPEVSLIVYTVDDSFVFEKSTWETGEQELEITNKFTLFDLIKYSSGSNITITPLDSNMYKDFMTSVHLADFIRIEKLYEHGGIWIDSDILFLKQLPHFFFDESNQFNVTSYANTIPTGILGSQRGGMMIARLYELALTERKQLNARSPYQVLGPNLWAKLFSDNHLDMSGINFFPPRLFYPYMWNEMHNFYDSSLGNRVGDDTYGIHWYNGNEASRRFINNDLVNAFQGIQKNSPVEKVLNALIQDCIIPHDLVFENR